MSTVLFASEGSSALCELQAQIAISNRLREQGHTVVFACGEIERVHSTLANLSHRFVAAPRSLASESRIRHPQNYEQDLLRLGFDDARTLSAHVHAWHHLFAGTHVDILVADHSPTALLAALAAGVPRVSIGNPFTIPWMHSLGTEAARDDLSATSCGPIIGRMNAVLAEHGRSPLVTITDLFTGAALLLMTFPQLDAARDHSCTYVGPIGYRKEETPIGWSGLTNRPRILARLHRDRPELQTILQQLHAIRGDVICCIPDSGTLKTNRLENFRVCTDPITVAPLLRDATLVVGNGDTELVARAAQAGVPQVILPVHAHEHLNARLAGEQGIALTVDAKRAPDLFSKAAREAILNSRYRVAAREFAMKCAEFREEEMIERAVALVVERCDTRS